MIINIQIANQYCVVILVFEGLYKDFQDSMLKEWLEVSVLCFALNASRNKGYSSPQKIYAKLINCLLAAYKQKYANSSR